MNPSTIVTNSLSSVSVALPVFSGLKLPKKIGQDSRLLRLVSLGLKGHFESLIQPSEKSIRRPEPGFSGNGSSQSARFLLRLFPGGLRRRRPQTVGSGHLLRAAWGSARRARPAHGCGTKWNGLLSSYAGKSPRLVLEGLKRGCSFD